MQPTVIVPLDTTPESEVSLPIAEALARHAEGMLMLISVIEAPSEFGVWLRAEETIDAWVDHHVHVDQYLSRIAGDIDGVAVDTLVSTGNPAVEINSIASEQPEPVIVMGSHARTGVSRVAVGSVAASVIHDARWPVIVARQADDDGGSAARVGPVNRILVALDGSEYAEQALSTAQAVLGSSGLDIHLLRVVETNKWYGTTYSEIDYAAVTTYIEAEQEAAEEYLDEQARVLEQAGHTVTWEVQAGFVAGHIVDAARQFNAGLIVMSTHGRSGLGRILMGSVAERVIHDADDPVMLVNPNAFSN